MSRTSSRAPFCVSIVSVAEPASRLLREIDVEIERQMPHDGLLGTRE